MEESLGTHVDFLAEPIMELLPSSPAMRIPLSLRPPDMHDMLQIFLNEAGSQEFGVVVCGSVFSRVDLSCFLHLSCSSYLRLQPICHGSQFDLHHHSLGIMHQCYFSDHHLDLIDVRCGIVLPGRACYLLPLHSSEMNAFKLGRMVGFALVII